ncbi:MAG: signal peptidase I [Nitrososphaerales archaeon]
MPSPRIRHAIKDVLIVVAGVITVWIALQAVFGTPNPFFVVSSGSMEPVLHIYDVLIVKNGSTFENVQRGDIIVFNRPEVHDRVIVHRIVDIKESSGRIITTKGDANPASIPGTDFPITEDDFIGEVIYVLPKIGYVTRLIQPPINYIIIAIILAVLFFNRTSRKKGEKLGKESPTYLADSLPDSTEEQKDTTPLSDTLPDDNTRDKDSFEPTDDQHHKNNETK